MCVLENSLCLNLTNISVVFTNSCQGWAKSNLNVVAHASKAEDCPRVPGQLRLQTVTCLRNKANYTSSKKIVLSHPQVMFCASREEGTF